MHKKAVLAIFVIGLLTFANSLNNGFTGDDEVKIIQNTFYDSWDNVGHLFDSQYLAHSRDYFVQNPPYFSSGEVSYRPVTSFSYFLDNWLWPGQPAGYHFLSVLIHLFTSSLVYFLIWLITKDPKAALLGALLFCVHPTKAEPVCSASYRHDLIAGLFGVAAFISYIFTSTGPKKRQWFFYGASLVLYALAVFAKESAIVLPALMIVYDMCFREKPNERLWKRSLAQYSGFLAAACFYLYTYFFIFPNTTLGGNALLGRNVFVHGMSAVGIFRNYCFDLFLPAQVTQLPPLYSPRLDLTNLADAGIAVGTLLVFLTAPVVAFKRERPVSFFILWFLMALLPVANIIPLANPMAHRFLYLPSVGWSAAVAVLVVKLGPVLSRSKNLPTIGNIIFCALIGLCAVMTIPLNGLWKNNYTFAKSLVKEFPEDLKSNSIVAITLAKAGACPEAAPYLEKSISLGSQDPRMFYHLGMCTLPDPVRARGLFEHAMRLAPEYNEAYLGMGRSYFFEGEYQSAVDILLKSFKMEPTYTAGAFLIQSYLRLNRRDQAEAVFERVKTIINDKKALDFLRTLLKEEPDEIS